jgi:NADH-quinone oxidoreductase subunit J
MPIEAIIFWAASAIAIVATLLVLLSKNPFYAVLYLILSLFGVALIFFSLGAPFLGVLEVIVYAGAIMVLFLFVVQMLSPGSTAAPSADMRPPGAKALILPGLLALILIICTTLAAAKTAMPHPGDHTIIYNARQIGIALFTNNYLGVELASLILLIGMVGGMHLGRPGTIEEEAEEGKIALR